MTNGIGIGTPVVVTAIESAIGIAIATGSVSEIETGSASESVIEIVIGSEMGGATGTGNAPAETAPSPPSIANIPRAIPAGPSATAKTRNHQQQTLKRTLTLWSGKHGTASAC